MLKYSLVGTILIFSILCLPAYAQNQEPTSMTPEQEYIQNLQQKVHSYSDQTTIQIHNSPSPQTGPAPTGQPGTQPMPDIPVPATSPYLKPNPWSNTTNNPYAPPAQPQPQTQPVPPPPPGTTLEENTAKPRPTVPNIFVQPNENQQPKVPPNIYK